MPKSIRTNGPTTVRALCETCDWVSRDNKRAEAMGEAHAEEKSHLVHIFAERECEYDGRVSEHP